jgi:hypothetical protein
MHAAPSEAILPRPFVEVLPLATGTTEAAEAEAHDDPNGGPDDARDPEDEGAATVCSSDESDQCQQRDIADE